jgi:outer membrane protein assembly factor BamB/DNA-binding HxlR family transcriptional regulator
METSNIDEDQRRAEVFDALSHPTRILILKALSEGALGFADIKKKLGIESSGHLQHHLNKLNGLIKTDEYGKYCLSDQGKDALLTVQTVENATQSGPKEPEKKRHDTGSKSVWKLIAMLLAISLVASSAVAVFEYTQTSQLQTEINDLKEKIATGTATAWERNIGTNIGDFLVDNGKVFAITFGGDLYALNQQDGRIIWSYSLGGYATWGHLLTIANGKIYAGSQGSMLTCFNEDPGTILWQFKPNVSSSAALRSTPGFELSNGKVLVNADGFYVLNAANGTLLWDSSSNPGVYQTLAFADNQVFAASIAGAPDYAKSLVSLNADTGQQQWSTQIGPDIGSLVVADGRIVLWGIPENQTLFGFDETSGAMLWKFDVNGTVSQPTIYSGLVLFGASNGNFYAINQNDGTLKWVYTSAQNQLDYVAFSALPDFDQILIGYITYSQPQHAVNYRGYILSLSLADGKVNWETPISNTAASPSVFAINLTLTTNRILYITAFSDLYGVNADSGKVQVTNNFTYWVLSPAYASGKLFVAADLKIIAYQ